MLIALQQEHGSMDEPNIIPRRVPVVILSKKCSSYVDDEFKTFNTCKEVVHMASTQKSLQSHISLIVDRFPYPRNQQERKGSPRWHCLDEDFDAECASINREELHSCQTFISLADDMSKLISSEKRLDISMSSTRDSSRDYTSKFRSPRRLPRRSGFALTPKFKLPKRRTMYPLSPKIKLESTKTSGLFLQAKGREFTGKQICHERNVDEISWDVDSRDNKMEIDSFQNLNEATCIEEEKPQCKDFIFSIASQQIIAATKVKNQQLSAATILSSNPDVNSSKVMIDTQSSSNAIWSQSSVDPSVQIAPTIFKSLPSGKKSSSPYKYLSSDFFLKPTVPPAPIMTNASLCDLGYSIFEESSQVGSELSDDDKDGFFLSFPSVCSMTNLEESPVLKRKNNRVVSRCD